MLQRWLETRNTADVRLYFPGLARSGDHGKGHIQRRKNPESPEENQLDKALREAYKGNGETFYPFRERYDCLKEYDYKSGKWRG